MLPIAARRAAPRTVSRHDVASSTLSGGAVELIVDEFRRRSRASCPLTARLPSAVSNYPDGVDV